MDDDLVEAVLHLRRLGLFTQAHGPRAEWSPQPPKTYRNRDIEFWVVVDGVIRSEPGTYDDLPPWMTEDATDLLTANTVN